VKRILVVEDDPHNALLFRKILERRGGFEVTVTEDAGRVVDLVRSGGTDLVIMDVSLANTRWEGRPVNGIELCAVLRSEASDSMPIMLATAHAMRGDAEKFVAQSGANGYVSKPIVDHQGFVDLIRSVLERGRRDAA
jgi:CheY-like chemotaxis protein